MTLHPAVAAVRVGVRRALAGLAPGQTVLVACSGGADSLALLAATVFEGHKAGLRVVGATVDHGLQQGSAARAEAVVAQMASLGVDETAAVRVQVDPAGLGVEAAARLARHDVLEELADHLGAVVVLLGHTRDDQAETVLLGLARGSGGRSIAGMRRAYGRVSRPLLDVTRADTVAACAAEGIAPWTDPHNEDPRFLRSRVRHRVLPVLEEQLGPGVAEALARTADLLRPDMEYLDEVAEQALRAVAEADIGLAVDRTSGLPDAVRTRVLRLAAVNAGAPPSELVAAHVGEMDRLLTDWHGQKWVDLPGAVRLVRTGRVLRFEARPR